MTVGNSDQYGVCWSLLSDRASRAMAYVGMTRGRDENHLAIYPAVTNEAHRHQVADTGIHQMRRGTKHAAARTDRTLLPTIVAALLDCNDQRRADRAQAWRRHSTQTRAREAAYQRFTTTRQQTAQRQRSRDQGCGREL
jgi:hypothetical protein